MIYQYTTKDGTKGGIDLSKVVAVSPNSDSGYNAMVSTPDGSKHDNVYLRIDSQEGEKLLSAWAESKEVNFA